MENTTTTEVKATKMTQAQTLEAMLKELTGSENYGMYAETVEKVIKRLNKKPSAESMAKRTKAKSEAAVEIMNAICEALAEAGAPMGYTELGDAPQVKAVAVKQKVDMFSTSKLSSVVKNYGAGLVREAAPQKGVKRKLIELVPTDTEPEDEGEDE